MVVHKARGERDAPRETDGRRTVRHGRRCGVVILLPVEIARTKSDDVLVLWVPLHDGVLGTHIGIERCRKEVPRERRCSNQERYTEQGEYIPPQKHEYFVHGVHPLGERSRDDHSLIFILIISSY